MEMLSSSEKLKTDYDKRVRSIQKEIDRYDEYKNKVNDLELKLKSNKTKETEGYCVHWDHTFKPKKFSVWVLGIWFWEYTPKTQTYVFLRVLCKTHAEIFLGVNV